MKMLSERKKSKNLKANIVKCVTMTAMIVICCTATCYAGDGDVLSSAKDLLGKAVTACGGFLSVWGLINLGISFKDHDGAGQQKAIMQLLGGAIVVAAGVLLGQIDLSMSV